MPRRQVKERPHKPDQNTRNQINHEQRPYPGEQMAQPVPDEMRRIATSDHLPPHPPPIPPHRLSNPHPAVHPINQPVPQPGSCRISRCRQPPLPLKEPVQNIHHDPPRESQGNHSSRQRDIMVPSQLRLPDLIQPDVHLDGAGDGLSDVVP
ncbi:hypothetical protein K461DRAFT_172088 [Myriangium duriaei CBS 260.36]|uniref:Uncharacterized protein n=1 Tax=Myriangium duriaei CBS 260.36 TaxID=1168546 RepID=A0A9P4IWT7_9PEZI|nr:hypothetical protein K461DRAFT_172088 [Myriangium duriaei CBS 260.36]